MKTGSLKVAVEDATRRGSILILLENNSARKNYVRRDYAVPRKTWSTFVIFTGHCDARM